jgi:hypothetical protein
MNISLEEIRAIAFDTSMDASDRIRRIQEILDRQEQPAVCEHEWESCGIPQGVYQCVKCHAVS